MRRCIYQTKLGQNAVFHNFSRQIALIQYSGRSIVGFQWNCSKNFQNQLYGQPVLTFDKRQICNASFSGFITMCNLKKHLIREAFWVTPENDVYKRLRTNGTAIKIARELRLPTTNKRNIIRWNICRFLGRQQFSFTKTSIKVPKNPESSRLLGVWFFERWIRGKKIAQSFLSTAKFMTKYSLERFLSIYCRSGGRCTVTWLPNFLEWVDSVSHGAPPMRFCIACRRIWGCVQYIDCNTTLTSFWSFRWQLSLNSFQVWKWLKQNKRNSYWSSNNLFWFHFQG